MHSPANLIANIKDGDGSMRFTLMIAPTHHKRWAAALTKRSIYEVEQRLRRHDAEYRYMNIRAVPILSQDGSMREWVGVHDDITERKQAETELQQTAAELARSEGELRQQTQILQSVLNSMGDGVVVADQNGKFLLFNPAAEKIMGVGLTDTNPNQWSQQYGMYLADGVTPYPDADVPLARAIRGEVVDNANYLSVMPVRHKAFGRELPAAPSKMKRVRSKVASSFSTTLRRPSKPKNAYSSLLMSKSDCCKS